MTSTGRVSAVLGPTNTGKTHYALERMLAHRTGIIGLPLRLLAREVYDRLVAARGPSVVALVTGEERIVPPRAAYWVCTVEAMPTGLGCDFAAVDEIQLCADPDRGHVFTDRLLNLRGLHETLFMGSDTMRPTIAALIPRAQFARRERFSELTYTGAKKISRMPGRTAIVGFSVDNVYAIAELLRRQKGGAAVVMGALSPRTRNAQVEMYQNGDVDYLVATDAIGMGLNLDIKHVAFSATSKFDGQRIRPLMPHELAQIAGRAGRYMQPGTFGVTGEAGPLEEFQIEAIQAHSFKPIDRLMWRSDRLDFGSPEALIASLETPSPEQMLVRGREADDLSSLKTLNELEGVASRVRDARDVRLLWDVCRIPDFQGISHGEHTTMLARIFGFLREAGRIDGDWFARQIKRIDRTEGEIDTLSKRLAYIRTWTYVAQRKGWVDDEAHWRGATRAVEDRLSDALHQALTKRFVDRRTSVLLRRLKMKEGLLADINDKGEVAVEGETLGRLEGFRFHQTGTTSPDEARTVRQAATQALRPEFHLRADRFYNAPDTEMDFTEQGGLMWGDQAVGKIVKGPEALRPSVEAFVDEDAGPEVHQKVTRRLQHFVDRKVAAAMEPLVAMSRDDALTGLARGFAFRMLEGFGILPRHEVAAEVKDLDQDARGQLRKHGIRFGQFTIFQQLLLKPAPTRLRLVLWSLWQDLQEFPEAPPPGMVTVPAAKGVPQGYYTMAGYRLAGQRAIRIDMLERLADLLRPADSRGGFEATPDMLSITGMTLEQFADLMGGLGYAAEKGERAKVRAAADAPTAPTSPDAPEVGEPPAPSTPDAPVVPEPDVPSTPDAPEAPVVPEPPTEPDMPTPDAPTPADVPDAPVVPVTPEDVPDVPPSEMPGPPGEVPLQMADDAATEGQSVEAPAPEMETFYTFTWAPRRQANRGPRREAQGDRPARKGGKPQGKGGPRRDGAKGKPDGGPKVHEARPKPREKPIDPDSPFAALAALKDR